MKCPRCESEDVQIMGFQSPQHQVTCNACGNAGTYYQFGLNKTENVDLVTLYDGAVYSAEQELFDASDPGCKVAATVHIVGEQCACNTWVRSYDQWLKFQPERVYHGTPSQGLLQGELIRLMHNDEKREQTERNERLKMGFI